MYFPTELWHCILNKKCGYEWINNIVKYDLMKANWSVIKIITTHLNLRNTPSAWLVQTRKTDVTKSMMQSEQGSSAHKQEQVACYWEQ